MEGSSKFTESHLIKLTSTVHWEVVDYKRGRSFICETFPRISYPYLILSKGESEKKVRGFSRVLTG